MIRLATPDDLATLADLQREASVAGLGHIFGAERPFPDAEVTGRWRLDLDNPDTVAALAVIDDEPVGYVACADGWILHLGVVPRLWGSGCAEELHDFAVADMVKRGEHALSLWVLEDNHRAVSFYRRLGWVDAGERDASAAPPHPLRMRMTLLIQPTRAR